MLAMSVLQPGNGTQPVDWCRIYCIISIGEEVLNAPVITTKHISFCLVADFYRIMIENFVSRDEVVVIYVGIISDSFPIYNYTSLISSLNKFEGKWIKVF